MLVLAMQFSRGMCDVDDDETLARRSTQALRASAERCWPVQRGAPDERALPQNGIENDGLEHRERRDRDLRVEHDGRGPSNQCTNWETLSSGGRLADLGERWLP
jgi:hypothetical protein